MHKQVAKAVSDSCAGRVAQRRHSAPLRFTHIHDPGIGPTCEWKDLDVERLKFSCRKKVVSDSVTTCFTVFTLYITDTKLIEFNRLIEVNFWT